VALKTSLPVSVVEFLRALIRIPSVNPAFSGDNGDLAGEHRMIAYLAELGAQAGLKVRIQKASKERENLLVTLPAIGKRKNRIILAPHLDTIGAGKSQLSGRLSDGKIWGRGACDTKGCVAAMFYSMLQLAADPNRPNGLEVCFVGLADEENAQIGSRAFANKCPSADLAIIGEPTQLQVVTAHKGDFWLEIETRGKAAHGSRPELGKNAVKLMADLVIALETEYAASLKRNRHSLLGHGTINVGTIGGGSQPNVVPDCCRIRVDRRSLPGESLKSVIREISGVARSKGVALKVTDIRGRPTPALETDPELPAVRQFLKTVGKRRTYGVDYFCDAAIISETGVPCVVFGPGDIAQAHTANEWISVASLRRGTELLQKYLKSFS
jgi:succinyl-diaminopimelate desuccinylase